MAETIFVENTNLLQVQGLQKEGEGTYINNATISGEIYDDTNTAVPGGPYTLVYVANSNGDYEAAIPETLAISVNKKYYAIVDISTADNIKAKRRLPLIGKTGV